MEINSCDTTAGWGGGRKKKSDMISGVMEDEGFSCLQSEIDILVMIMRLIPVSCGSSSSLDICGSRICCHFLHIYLSHRILNGLSHAAFMSLQPFICTLLNVSDEIYNYLVF